MSLKMDTPECAYCGREHSEEKCYLIEQKKFTCRWCQQHHTHLEKDCLKQVIEKKERELESLKAYQLLPQVLRCPFCNCDNVLISMAEFDYYIVQCQRCGANTKNIIRNTAVKAWNTRGGVVELLNDPELSRESNL